jgi:hypothetical protein
MADSPSTKAHVRTLSMDTKIKQDLLIGTTLIDPLLRMIDLHHTIQATIVANLHIKRLQ